MLGMVRLKKVYRFNIIFFPFLLCPNSILGFAVMNNIVIFEEQCPSNVPVYYIRDTLWRNNCLFLGELLIKSDKYSIVTC